MVLSWSCYSTFVSVKSKGNRDLGCQKLQKFLACGAACLPRSGTSKRSLFSLAHRYPNVLGSPTPRPPFRLLSFPGFREFFAPRLPLLYVHVRGRRCANEYPIIGHYDRGPVIRLITGEVAQVPYRVRCRDMLVPPTHAVGPLCLLYRWRLKYLCR